ncbi:dCTP deaminase [Sorangium sp. So ce375]|uniref:dCTP deaminase n=1 Tax=Sorangium sp. So ce375 TaxID=3133306 RepID=UPI003F5BFF89
MILTDREIEVALSTNAIRIVPAPDASSYASTSLDLTLDSKARRWNTSNTKGIEQPIICPGSDGYSYQSVVQQCTTDITIATDGYVLEPGAFLLAWTREFVELPYQSRLAARVEGKSSLARLGVGIHVTAPTIHAGFSGQIQLEVFNHGQLRIRLTPGLKICQLIFEQTAGTPEKGYSGMFSGQSSTT